MCIRDRVSASCWITVSSGRSWMESETLWSGSTRLSRKIKTFWARASRSKPFRKGVSTQVIEVVILNWRWNAASVCHFKLSSFAAPVCSKINKPMQTSANFCKQCCWKWPDSWNEYVNVNSILFAEFISLSRITLTRQSVRTPKQIFRLHNYLDNLALHFWIERSYSCRRCIE